MTIPWRRALVVSAVIVLATVLLSATSTLPARLDFSPLPKADVDRELDHATVSFVALGCDLSLTGGTGVAVGADRILTNRHVVERFRSLDLVYDATQPRLLTRQQIGVNTGDDVAVVRSAGLGLPAIPLAPADPRPGAPVWVAGYARELQTDALPSGLAVKAARVRGYAKGSDLGQRSRVMRVDVPVRAGMSGGPVLDEAGRLAGLIFAVRTPPGEGLVLPVSALRVPLAASLPAPAAC